ncbi:hypothetical protein GOODEAATRI_025584 [Goodea atripinnis]|uniref:Uncharacterized protein n=1 Tax=Goodea atripinnis TaxID=208336 RepID=A0ABV0Q165_9TELE
MNMLKSSGLKIPGRGAKHSSPVGRTSVGGISSPVAPKDRYISVPHLFSQAIWEYKGRFSRATNATPLFILFSCRSHDRPVLTSSTRISVLNYSPKLRAGERPPFSG